ncbi:hypothetical protein H0484_00300 [Pusillimonas sp. CC-YST705]|uniref:TM2 domain-containing protein n=1 Tax=Mesopusillimonas faecipullorum TaxID=2755040 RepID=A0ABS8C849_9BURK|nr:hypothetical protein [Mesopusillimonas faecipullorum]MCB5362203.1 hypothetical protein [Mesopusillimonas faecipullorum]
MNEQHRQTGSSQGRRHRSKVIVALLAALLGVVHAHWWYVGRPYAWLATLASFLLIVWAALSPVWWDTPAFFLLAVPITAGFIESLVFALKTDEWFDARYNPGSGQQTRTGWAPVLIAIFSTMVGSSALLFMLALTVLHVYKALGWLDDYVL